MKHLKTYENIDNIEFNGYIYYKILGNQEQVSDILLDIRPHLEPHLIESFDTVMKYFNKKVMEYMNGIYLYYDKDDTVHFSYWEFMNEEYEKKIIDTPFLKKFVFRGEIKIKNNKLFVDDFLYTVKKFNI